MEIIIEGGKPSKKMTRYSKSKKGEMLSKGVKMASCGDRPLRGALLEELKSSAKANIKKEQKKKAAQAKLLQAKMAMMKAKGGMPGMPPGGAPGMPQGKPPMPPTGGGAPVPPPMPPGAGAPRPNVPGNVPQMPKGGRPSGM